MSLLRSAVKAAWRTEQEFTNYTVPPFGLRTRAGVNVTTARALGLAPVYACVKLRAESLGATPVDVVGYANGARQRRDRPQWMDVPNPECTPFELWEKTSAALDVDGNAFWYLVRNNLGRVVEVWPLPPVSVVVRRDRPTADNPAPPVRYWVGDEEVPRRHILHIRGFSLPGWLRSPSPIQQEMHALGLAIAAEEFGEAFFGNGAVMSGVIESPTDPGERGAIRMRTSFARDHQGVSKAHLPGFLFGGAQWKQLSVPNEQAQFLETRNYQLREICRIFRVPPHKIGDLERATFSNIEHQAIEWVTDGLIPAASRIEHAIQTTPGMLDDDERLRFNFAAQLRGDLRSRYQAYAIGRQWGWLSADDIRELEDENPLPDGQGQTYLEPLNMRPADEPNEPEGTR